MNEAPSSLTVDECLHLGRLLFDGATVTELAARFNISTNEVDSAWSFCLSKLSEHFAKVDGVDFRCYTLEELRERGMETLRLLLDWRQAAINKKIVESFEPKLQNETDREEPPQD